MRRQPSSWCEERARPATARRRRLPRVRRPRRAAIVAHPRLHRSVRAGAQPAAQSDAADANRAFLCHPVWCGVALDGRSARRKRAAAVGGGWSRGAPMRARARACDTPGCGSHHVTCACARLSARRATRAAPRAGQIYLSKPTYVELDQTTTAIFPNEARLRNLTYAAPI
eukprot:2907395-Prymnesium_polylepis.2